MPRPGPRPYECVRRAWHSDRHQAMRGSIIQQIFRVVHETHSAATKKNREWQEKLPVVVFKAEEIMYSKANSEAEYTNQETLWDRLNDAINTIIRRDETTETGDLLPPCIEAALNLGCIPVRASRSQRHSNPRSYLSPRVQEPVSSPPRPLDVINDGCNHVKSALHCGNNPRASTAVNSNIPVPESDHQLFESDNVGTSCSYSLMHKNTSRACHLLVTKDNKQPDMGSVYPLYYGKHHQSKESQLAFQDSLNTNAHIIYVGRPIGPSVADSAEMGVLHNLFPCSSVDISPNIMEVEPRNTHEELPHSQCDLSLRLCLFQEPSTSLGRSSIHESKDAGLSGSQLRGLCSRFSPERREFHFFPDRGITNPIESCSVDCLDEQDTRDLDTTVRSCKTPFHDNVGDGEHCCQSQFPSSQFIGRMEGPGS